MRKTIAVLLYPLFRIRYDATRSIAALNNCGETIATANHTGKQRVVDKAYDELLGGLIWRRISSST